MKHQITIHTTSSFALYVYSKNCMNERGDGNYSFVRSTRQMNSLVAKKYFFRNLRIEQCIACAPMKKKNTVKMCYYWNGYILDERYLHLYVSVCICECICVFFLLLQIFIKYVYGKDLLHSFILICRCNQLLLMPTQIYWYMEVLLTSIAFFFKFNIRNVFLKNIFMLFGYVYILYINMYQSDEHQDKWYRL